MRQDASLKYNCCIYKNIGRGISVSGITNAQIAKTVKMLTKVLFLSNLENKEGMNNPQIAIVNVKELT